MNARTLAIIAAATAALVIVAALTTLSGGGSASDLPERLAPGLYDRAAEIERIRIDAAEGMTVLVRDDAENGPTDAERWNIAEPYHGYPADPARVGTLLRTLAELTPAQRRTADPQRHDLLGVHDVPEGEPRPEGAARVTLTDAEDGTIADIILGERAQTGRYARRAGENQSWLTEGRATIPQGPRRYLPSPVLEIPSTSIESIDISPAQASDGDIGYSIRRSSNPESGPPFSVAGLPDGAELNSDANDILSRIVSSLSFVTPRDVLPADEAPTNADIRSTAVVRTTDGLSLAITITPITTSGRGAPTEAWVRIIPSRDANNSTAGDAPDAEPSSDAAFAELRRRLDGWALKLSGPIVDRLRTRENDLILQKPAPGAPPEPPGLR